MSASQLLRILQTLPVGTDDEICASKTDELEASMNKSSRYTNPFLSNEENNKVNIWNSPELEHSIITNNHEDEKFSKSLFEKTTGFYIDKNSVECELPELIVCYKERDFHVKGISIDEGIPDEDKEFPQGELCTSGQTTNILNRHEIEGSVAFNFDTAKPATASDPSRAMNPESSHELSLETQSALNLQDVAVANEMQYGEESSFSMAGVISELISCSRPITFSGNISTRSDSSATSTRSFAFPTLQTEWNSSPVRMRKAERRRLQKQRGWRQGLLCFRF